MRNIIHDLLENIYIGEKRKSHIYKIKEKEKKYNRSIRLQIKLLDMMIAIENS